MPHAEHRYPEGYTNEYDDAYAPLYFGSDGKDHAHFTYDNVDDIDVHHGHFDPDSHAKVRPFQPPVNQYFVPTINTPRYEADYDGDLDPLMEVKAETYTDKTTGLQYRLYDNSLVPGQAYKSQYGSHHEDHYIPNAHVEKLVEHAHHYEEEVIPTEVIYDNHASYGKPTVTAVPHTSHGGSRPSSDGYLNDYMNDEALDFSFLDNYEY